MSYAWKETSATVLTTVFLKPARRMVTAAEFPTALFHHEFVYGLFLSSLRRNESLEGLAEFYLCHKVLWLRITPLTPTIFYDTVSNDTGKSKVFKQAAKGRKAYPAGLWHTSIYPYPAQGDCLQKNSMVVYTLQKPNHVFHFNHRPLPYTQPNSFHFIYFFYLL